MLGKIEVENVVENEDGSFTVNFDADKGAIDVLIREGLVVILSCALHELDLKHVPDAIEAYAKAKRRETAIDDMLDATGDILYIENALKTERADGQAENIKLIISF